MIIMTDEKLREEIKRYKETFGTPLTWMARKFGVSQSVLSYFVLEIDRKISDTAMQKIRDGYEKLPKSFVEEE